MNVEGKNAVREAVASAKTVDKVLVQNGLRDAESRKLVSEIKECGIKFSFADKSVLDKLSTTKKHQGFIAFLSDFSYCDEEDIIEDASKNGSVILVLDGIEDPHNLGSIIRVGECGGVAGIIIGKHRSATVTDTVMRISEGSANHVKIAKVTNINACLEKIKAANIFAYALELGGENIYETNLTGAIAIVVGGEDTGVNALTKKICDGVITIPMFGKINSLNASVAAGIALFESVRQRTTKSKK